MKDSVRGPKRILYVEGNTDGTIGGSFFSLLFLVSGLDRNRYEPTVVFANENSLMPRFHAKGIETVIVPLRPAIVWPGAAGRLLAKPANLVRGMFTEPRRLAALLRERRIDLLHLNNSITRNHPWMVAARLAGIRCITHERGINPKFLHRSRALGRRLDGVICISSAVHDNFLATGLGDLRLHTIPNGLDPAEMRAKRPAEDIRRELGVPDDAQLIGMVGNIKRWKGQEVVIRAMAHLRDRLPKLRCVLVGASAKGDSFDAHVKRLIEESGLAGRVIITGYRSDVPDVVNALDLVIHASINPEPFGRVLLEAMALRKPLVASRGGAVPEIVEDGVTGLLFTPGDAADLARQLSELLPDPARLNRMGDAGYTRLLERFTIDRNVERTQELYASLLGA